MRKKFVVLSSVLLVVGAFGAIAHAQDAAKVAGTWTMTNQGRNGVVTTTLTLTQDGMNVSGTMKGETGPEMELDSGSVSGKDITFTVTRQGRNGDVKVEYKGTIDGDTMKGTFMQGQNPVDWTAKRS
jgi:hypothetical protein